MHVHKYKPIYS